ncbi:MAG: hypothetical protein WBA57_10945 [Elainellaceae cyanobacterium]
MLKLFAELDTLIKGLALPDDAKDEASTYLKAAKTATEKDKPKEAIRYGIK